MLSKITAASVVLAAASVSAQTVVNPQPTQSQNIAVVQEQAAGNVLRAGAPARRFPLCCPSS